MVDSSKQRVFRFGIFEADRRTGELRKQGRRLSLQGQPFEILIMLLERPGELITRAEIRERLWPEGTFVDFDHSLNTAVNKVRDALGDSAGNPRFIETLARRGYRFLAAVEAVDGARSDVRGQIAEVNGVAHQPERRGMPATEIDREKVPAVDQRAETWGILTSPHEMPNASHRVVRSLFFLLQVMYFCFYVISLARLHAVEEIVGGALSRPMWVVVALIITAVVGIPTRLYLMAGVAFNAPGLREKFLRLFVVIFPLDELWALAPFLLVRQVGYGLALGMTAILLYVPFAERSLMLMGAGRTVASTQ